MGEIEEEAYSEAMGEIERMKGEIGAMAKLAVLLKADIAGKDAEIGRLKALLARAADVLEVINKGWPISELGLDPAIIAELRKAAE